VSSSGGYLNLFGAATLAQGASTQFELQEQFTVLAALEDTTKKRISQIAPQRISKCNCFLGKTYKIQYPENSDNSIEETEGIKDKFNFEILQFNKSNEVFKTIQPFLKIQMLQYYGELPTTVWTFNVLDYSNSSIVINPNQFKLNVVAGSIAKGAVGYDTDFVVSSEKLELDLLNSQILLHLSLHC